MGAPRVNGVWNPFEGKETYLPINGIKSTMESGIRVRPIYLLYYLQVNFWQKAFVMNAASQTKQLTRPTSADFSIFSTGVAQVLLILRNCCSFRGTSADEN